MTIALITQLTDLFLHVRLRVLPEALDETLAVCVTCW